MPQPTMLKKIILYAVCLMAFSGRGNAEELWLRNIPLSALNRLYADVGYQGEKDYLMLDTLKYPPIFLKNFPAEFFAIEDEQQRNRMFIKILAPLTLKLNQDILAKRRNIEDIAKRSPTLLSLEDIAVLESASKKYDIFSRLKGTERYNYLTKELLRRVDVIPPSVMITAAAIDTDFGASRALKQGNSLYKILNWNTAEGLKPIGDENAEYRLRTYPDIYASLQDFAYRINTSPNFEFFRITREQTRAEASTYRISGHQIATYLFTNSELKNYAGVFDYTMSYYELPIIDRSLLDEQMVSSDIVRKYTKFKTAP
ncbi:MAG: glucosaminidase domain-containing protein [Alphaproteobacteria bacterium]|nr:glucosaminidase domain-containing protein [Alphaproteobacteria bacterium]MBQ9234905.1 glucosaminidase domain-containing protein [Alphaproteobacteria bacterium]